MGSATLLHEEPLSRVEITPMLSIGKETAVLEVIHKMQEHRVGSVAIVENGTLAGIFTERDVLKKVLSKPASERELVYKKQISELMTPKPYTLPIESSTLGDATKVFDEHRVRHLPLVGPDGKVVSIITVRHVLNFLISLYPAEVYNHPPELGQNHDAPDGA
ncbi:MAG: CBS domain-containing protein [Planctomycetes bacterium]|nr:CBS domain-containing protein [Planctomycetota bacterium]